MESVQWCMKTGRVKAILGSVLCGTFSAVTGHEEPLWVKVWRSGNALVSINEVNLR